VTEQKILPNIYREKKKKSSSLIFTSFKAKPAMAEWRITSVSTDIYSFSGATAHWFKKMPQK